jgi:hypothetical protein
MALQRLGCVLSLRMSPILYAIHRVSAWKPGERLCDYAGINLPAIAFDGCGLRPLAEGRAPQGRDYLAAESEHDRMVRTGAVQVLRLTVAALTASN